MCFMKKFTCALLIILISFNVTCAATVSKDLNQDSEIAKEREIGRKAMKQIEEQWPLTSDPAAISKLEVIMRKLEPYMERRFDWEIRLVKSDALNAFCLPGGYIFFTTGMLKMLNTDSELAAVMAHEMIHADKKHGLKMAAEKNKVTLGAIAVMLLGASAGTAAPILLAQVAQIAITSSYTMELETEADRLGMQALIKSGYSPTGMITLFERFIAEDYKQPVRDYGIYMDHPETPKRLELAIKALRDRNIPIERKYPLGLLRTKIQEESNNVTLLIDGRAVLSGDKKPETRDSIAKMREAIDKYLQLELAPYELHLVNGALYIGNHLTAGNVEGITKPEEIRKNLLKAINLARAKYPTARFFK